jgi:hypothetical protein
MLAAAPGAQIPAPTGADWTWLEQHRERALGALMPIRSIPRHIVTYRSYRDLYQDEYERYFTIGESEGGAARPERLIATIVVPVTKSIQQQLLELHMSDRRATLESLLPRVTVARKKVSQDGCPVLAARTEALRRLGISLWTRDVIILHPTVHRIVADNGGESIDATLWDDESAAVRWAVETLNALQRCDGEEH